MMPRLAQRYEIYLPRRYNDGRMVETQKFRQTLREIYERFGGCTAIRQENYLLGYWVEENQVYQDEVIIIYVVDSQMDSSEWMMEYKQILKERFNQTEIFIVQQEIKLI